jgi:hypothetical protein
MAMPLTKKGEKILRKLKEEYGENKGEAVFYAMINKGKLKGVHRKSPHKRPIHQEIMDAIVEGKRIHRR